MGELFRRHRPGKPLAWTGERLVTDVEGAIESEHLHRYFLARDLCRGKDVLDVASGEGYGSALLAHTAAQVVGVELDHATVEHASAAYKSSNLRYLQGEATRLPLDAASVDVVVSFETLEHFFDHALFFAEVKRVLRPDGFLIVSTPDTYVYSGPSADPNPFHVRELTSAEFTAELKQQFSHVAMYRQRVLAGSAILPDDGCAAARDMWMYEQRDAETFEAHRRLPHAPYLIAVASNTETQAVAASLYLQSPKVADQKSTLQLELERLQAVEAASRLQAPLYQQAVANATAASEEIQRLKCVLAPLQVELERLRVVESASREQTPQLKKAQEDHSAARAEAASLASELVLVNAELHRLQAVEQTARIQGPILEKALQDLAAAQTEIAVLTTEIADAREDSESLRQQLNASASLVRQQTLVVQRLQAAASKLHVLIPEPPPAEQPPPEPEPVPEELAPPPAPEPEPEPPPVPPAKPLIPVWLRRWVPDPLKPPLRAIKRAIRSQDRS